MITGMGAVTPLGLNAGATWKSAVRGVSGLAPLAQPILAGVVSPLACEVKGFDPETVVSKKEVRRQDRYQNLALAATAEAMMQAGLTLTDANRHRTGVIISASSGGYQTFENELLTVQAKGGRACSPLAIAKIMPNGASALVAMRYGAMGPSYAVCSACSSSTDAVGHAMLLLRAGICDVVVAGGAEASLHTISVASFGRMGLLSERTTGTPSPFCRQRDGLVIGEGAAVLVLETLTHARNRSAPILAELAGYGATSDAHHITSPSADGAGASRAMQAALQDGKINADQIDYINAHGTGTIVNDAVETRAVKHALGHHASATPISSTKGMTGHLMGAAGALEALLMVMTIRTGILPPTINYVEPDPECDLDYVPNSARERRVAVAMSNSFGFGGHNSVLIAKAFN